MLQNAYLLAKIGADTAESERKFAEILPQIDKVKVLRYNYGGQPLRLRQMESRTTRKTRILGKKGRM